MFTAKQLRNSDMALLRRVERQQEMKQQRMENSVAPIVPPISKVNSEIFNQGSYIGLENHNINLGKKSQPSQKGMSQSNGTLTRLGLYNKRGGRR